LPRVILVDDSASVRALLGEKLRAEGFDVVDVADAVTGAERALASPPNVVITDLWMPGISGVQLCRLLRAEPATAHVPVVLLTASDDRKSRFWARSAGAIAYVTKTRIDDLLGVLHGLTRDALTAPPTVPRAGLLGTIHERLSQLLDAALYESVIAGEVRALAQHDGDARHLFTDLVRLASDVVSYRWLALGLDGDVRLFLHASPASRAAAESEARSALGLDATATAVVLEDERALDGRPSTPLVSRVSFGANKVGILAMSAGPRGASRDDETFLRMVASELGGSLRMLSLVEDARRLAATDALTGLLNRRAFVDAMVRERSRADRHLFQMSLLLLDVDHFKRVNDTRGHAAGDAVLRGVANVLTRMARKSDLVARWGGEEFVIALTQTGEAGARVAAERVRRAIADAVHILDDGEKLSVTASVGLASAQPLWTVDDLVTRADEAMYAAKSRGRNRVEVA
jgi:two-component system, cell cycle response regulator